MGRVPLVGHEHERAVLEDALTRCREGAGGVLLVSGEAGVGKTRLVTDELDGWTGRRHRSAARPGADPFVLLDGLVGPTGAVSPERVVRALVDLARREPCVLLLDDLQWADAASLELLPAVAEAVAEAPMLVVGIYRTDELPRAHSLRRVRAELRRTHRLVDVSVRSLDRDQTGELLGGLLGTPPAPRLLTAVYERTDGLPFFVEELVAALVEGEALVERSGRLDLAPGADLPIPEGVVEAVLARTERLRTSHPDAVQSAAVLGVHVDLPALAELSGPAGVDALLDAGLLLELDPEGASFRHALVRESLYRSIPWARRRELHRRAAGTLGQRGSPPAVVADHWIAAHEPLRARPLLLDAAERSCAMHAYRDAATAIRRALALWPEAEEPEARLATLARLAECAEHCGQLTEAVSTWSHVAQRRRADGDVASGAEAHRRAANAAELLGDRVSTAVQRAEAAAAFTEACAPDEAAAELLALAAQLKTAGRMTAALEQATAAAAAADKAGRADLRGHALALQGAVRSALGHGREGIALARSGLELALAGRLTERVGETYYEYGEAFEYAADYANAVEAYESAFELCRTQGLTELAQVCFVCTSPVVRLMGDWDRSLAICAEVLADVNASALTRHVAEGESGLITALRGDARKARGRLRRAAEFGRAGDIFGLEVGARWGLALVADLDQDEADSRRAVAGILERCQATEECHYALPALRWAASHLAEGNDPEGIQACHRVVAAQATRNSSPKVLSALAHVGAELAAAQAEPDQARMQFARSLDLLEGITAPFERAHTQLRSGLALARSGDDEAATALLTGSYHIARRLGARPLASSSTRALAAMGVDVDRRLGRSATRSLAPAGLTRREHEVLGHLADGRTNRDIAAALFLSTRTVDMHVRNILAKLGCPSRATAVRRAVSLGLVAVDR